MPAAVCTMPKTTQLLPQWSHPANEPSWQAVKWVPPAAGKPRPGDGAGRGSTQSEKSRALMMPATTVEFDDGLGHAGPTRRRLLGTPTPPPPPPTRRAPGPDSAGA